MGYSRKILDKVDVPTDKLKMETIQELLTLSKQELMLNNEIEFWSQIAEKLWIHLMKCFDKLDDQLLCAICFYSIISLTDKQDHYLDKLLHIVGSQYIRKNTPGSINLLLGVESTPSAIATIKKEYSILNVQVVSLIYGVFQSSFLTQNTHKNIPKIEEVLKETVNLLLLMGYEFSQYTFLVFKTIKSFKKVCGGPLEKYIFFKGNQIKILELVNNNWENPITGVRDLNRSIFQTILSTLDMETYKRVLMNVDTFCWNKAKYLMLTEIVDNHTSNLETLLNKKCIDGLFYSLHKPGLVSAGADMYYAILKRINTQDDWCEMFLSHVINIIVGNNMKTVENFSNYWCLSTIKKFGRIVYVLITELEKYQDSEEILYFKLCIIKHANKLGIIDKNWNTGMMNKVLGGINHCNSNIRICAFDIICLRSQGKLLPDPLEYDLILDYLSNNINSDSTVLRLSMINGFNMFLSQLHTVYINVITKNQNEKAIDNLLFFCKMLQCLIVDNIKIKGNYQRKITCVKLCNSLLTHFSEIPRKKKEQTRNIKGTLKEFLAIRKHWLLSADHFIKNLIILLSDPAEDVRKNVIKILLRHYSEELHNATLLTLLTQNAKKNIRSKFFYEIDCGHSMFTLITNLVLKENNYIQTEYRTVHDIFDYAYNELVIQHKNPTNIMDSIEAGRQLHSFMGILLVVLEGCITNNYKLNIHTKMPELLEVIRNISNQFAWEKEGSSDFSKMNDMVQKIIDNSDYSNRNEDDCTISGTQHIVLNCMWLNVKASCDLASILVRYNDNNADLSRLCLNIIARVLETSRHKGAIEAAGAALGRSIQYLTGMQKKSTNTLDHEMPVVEENDVSVLPQSLLESKLNELISETNKMSSTTRRGAGLSILVHRIVSSDMQKGKPLFHYFIRKLLQICDTKENLADQIELCEDAVTQVDLPKAIYIHFLTKIVTDSSLAMEVMFYSVELAELAFGNLTSPHWQIRNAALQLYGALVPRLIGQKKASGTDEETIATVACDELRTHLPKLWDYITEQLKQNCNKNDILAHSNLVPILNMLANSAKRYRFSLENLEQETQFDEIFSYLVYLLNSPVYVVRRLTARTIFNLYKFDYICNGILKQEIITENLLHGLLLLLNLCYNYYQDSVQENLYKELKTKFYQIFNTRIHSYMNRALFEGIFGHINNKECIENTLTELKNNDNPGVHTWVELRLKKFIDKCNWDDMPDLLTIVLQQIDYEKYCEFILHKIKTQSDIPVGVIRKLADILITHENRIKSCIIWKTIYEISLKVKINIKADLLRTLKEQVPHYLIFAVPVMARCITNFTYEDKEFLIAIINNLSDFEKSDADIRYIASVANNHIAQNFDNLPDSLKVDAIKCSVFLLQDEDTDIRNSSVEFYSILCKEKKLFQPCFCLNKILEKDFLCSVFYKPATSIPHLCGKLNDVISQSKHNTDESNPFSNDSKNIYYEPEVLKQIVDSLNGL